MNIHGISIIGLSGTFKTTAGSILANLLGWQFVDIDRHITMHKGMSINNIFEMYGQDYFRQLETKHILEVSEYINIVVSVGGGAVLNTVNMQLLERYTTVWLDSDVQSIYHRLGQDNFRPLLQGDMLCQLHKMYQDRYQLYKRYADVRIPNSNMTSLETAQAIYSHIMKQLDTPKISTATKNSTKLDVNSTTKPPTLYIVATPIGNLGDMTIRAIDLLKGIDYIACEDTRTALTILNKYNINSSKLLSCHKFNEKSATTKIINILQQGNNVALISDAGTPCISDPGSVLVQAVRQSGYAVTSLPGASCVVSSMSISGFEGDWAFLGFMPKVNKLSKLFVNKMQSFVVSNYILLESPNRILDTLEYLHDNLPDARYMLAKELTKIHEYSTVGTYYQVVNDLNANTIPTKGEYTIIIQPNYKRVDNDDIISLEALLCDQLVKGKDIKQSIAYLANKYSKNELYQASLNLKKFFNN